MVSTVAYKGHSILRVCFGLVVFEHEISYLRRWNFMLVKTKFRVGEDEISCLRTRNFMLVKTKFHVGEDEISCLRTKEFQEFRVCLKAWLPGPTHMFFRQSIIMADCWRVECEEVRNSTCLFMEKITYLSIRFFAHNVKVIKCFNTVGSWKFGAIFISQWQWRQSFPESLHFCANNYKYL